MALITHRKKHPVFLGGRQQKNTYIIEIRKKNGVSGLNRDLEKNVPFS